MMEDTNLFSEVNAGRSKMAEGIKRTVNNYLPYLLLLLVIVLRALLEIYVPGTENPFTLVFFLDTSVSIAMTLLCYLIFIPQGEKNEKLLNTSYHQNCLEWSKLSERIRNGNFQKKFKEFCIKQIDVEREDKRREIIGNNTSLSYETYKEKYLRMSLNDLKKEYKDGKLSKVEYKAILAANGRIKIRPINPVLVLSGVEKRSFNDAGRSESNYILLWLAKRPFVTLLFAMVVNLLTSGKAVFDTTVFYGIILDTVTLIVAAFVGDGAGRQSVRDRNDKIKGKILFINGFFEDNT
jgi:hypothetical protein